MSFPIINCVNLLSNVPKQCQCPSQSQQKDKNNLKKCSIRQKHSYKLEKKIQKLKN
jgi:hypothetical protein